jgi:glycosyltransferase involved in cell wall biosynthesis
MISICIPIYNFDVTELVVELHRQASKLNIPFQILLMDDASTEKFRINNRELEKLENVEYIQLASNLGRTGIRNRLAQTAAYQYLLFMDCDSKVVDDLYLERYLPYFQPGTVCSGGRAYSNSPAEEGFALHWKVGVTKEVASAKKRSLHPNRSFMSCNFVIDKDIFQTVKFDERLKGYCNEDTLFGIELERKGVVIKHIDNPLYHIGLEPSDDFLSKIENGIRNLHKIDRLLDSDALFVRSVTIMQLYHKLKKFHITPLISFLYQLLKKPIRKNLFGKQPNLKLYDFYKLGYLCHTRNWPNE